MPRIGFESWEASSAVIDGRRRTVFGGCNYLGLAHHPEVQRAAIEAIGRWGLTTTASRETTGNTRAHEALESEIAQFLGKPAAILTTEGYTANIALLQGLAGGYQTAILDERAHSSVVFAVRSAGLDAEQYPHLSARGAVERARAALARGRRVVVMADGVFAAGGGVTPCAEILRGLPAEGALLVIDDCHGFTVLGEQGRGTADHFGVSADPRLIITTTFGKGLGCYGGAVVGGVDIVSSVRDRSKIYMGTTPCPPPMVEAARTALRIISTDDRPLASLRRNIAEMQSALIDAVGWTPPGHECSTVGRAGGAAQVPIFAFARGDRAQMEETQRRLDEAGFFVPLIDYPGGPTPWYFRPTVTAGHGANEIREFGVALGRAMGLGPKNPGAPTRESARP